GPAASESSTSSSSQSPTGRSSAGGGRVTLHSIELRRADTKELVAGELGCLVGNYTSLTGFFDSKSPGLGSVQMAALGAYLSNEGLAQMWDIGMDIEYKRGLGARNLPRTEFVRTFRHLRDESSQTGARCSAKNCREIIDTFLLARRRQTEGVADYLLTILFLTAASGVIGIRDLGLAIQSRVRPGPPTGFCLDGGFLEEVRDHAYYYYRTGEMEAEYTTMLTTVYESANIKQNCTVAILQAVLLKLEQTAPLDHEQYLRMIDHYMDTSLAYLDEVDAITTSDVDSWPIAAGIERLIEIERRSVRTRDLTVDMILNYCQSIDWRNMTQPMKWLRSPVLTPHWSIVNIHVYLVQQPHCDQHAVTTILRLLAGLDFRSVHVEKYFTGGPNREEQSAYFHHIAKYYHSLGDWLLFMHPDSDEHQGDDFIALSRALKLIHRGSEFALETLGVYPLSQQFIFRPKRVRAEPFRWAWQRIWGTQFPGEWEETLSFYEAGQYIVRRDFVHVHPLPFWERLRTDTDLNNGRFSGDIEAMWHV
ncbi:hypothetical protein FOZ62_000243, partial [Perkinsus olseni]